MGRRSRGILGPAPTAMMYDPDDRSVELTQLGRFMVERYIKAAWLAQQVGVSPATVSRWCWGRHGMTPSMRDRVMEVLRQRAREQEPPPGLLDDQLETMSRAAVWSGPT